MIKSDKAPTQYKNKFAFQSIMNFGKLERVDRHYA